MTAFALLALAASIAIVDAPSNPLAEVRKGNVQCYQPDDLRRNCRSIASYVQINETAYANKAVVLISAAGPIILETTTTVTIKAGAVCGFIRAEDVHAGKLWVANRLLSDTEAAPFLTKVVQSMEAIIGREICTSYLWTESGLTAKASINGVYEKNADQPVKWIKPDEGYVVAP